MDGSALRATLQESRDGLLASLRGLGEEQFRHTPHGGAWNIATHLAHLLRTEREHVEHARRDSDVTAPDTTAANDGDDALAQRLAVPQIIHGLQASRRQLEALIDGAHTPAAAAAGAHVAAHEREHAAAIAALARSAPQSPPVIPLAPRA